MYASNNQLGGIQIMFNNGVTHKTEGKQTSRIKTNTNTPKNKRFIFYCNAALDLDGIYTILSWLAYIPAKIGTPVPIVIPNDPIDRPVGFVPTKAPYDPRCMIAGRPNPTNPGEWETGLFDRDSWSEIMVSYLLSFSQYPNRLYECIH